MPGATATKSGCATGTRVPSLKRNTKGFVSRFSRSRIKFEFMVFDHSRCAGQIQLNKRKNTVDFRRRSAKFAGYMKCDTTNAILTFVLGVLAVAGVIFALQTIFLTREFRQLSVQAAFANNSILQAQSLAADAAAFNQKNPSLELTRVLQAVQAKPAAK
jgi:hypothetical protein